MNKSNRSPEVRECAVRWFRSIVVNIGSCGGAIESIAPKVGCVPQTLHEWVRPHEIDSGLRVF